MLARFEHVQKCWPTFEVIALENLFLSKSSLKKLFTNKTVKLVISLYAPVSFKRSSFTMLA